MSATGRRCRNRETTAEKREISGGFFEKTAAQNEKTGAYFETTRVINETTYVFFETTCVHFEKTRPQYETTGVGIEMTAPLFETTLLNQSRPPRRSVQSSSLDYFVGYDSDRVASRTTTRSESYPTPKNYTLEACRPPSKDLT